MVGTAEKGSIRYIKRLCGNLTPIISSQTSTVHSIFHTEPVKTF